MHPITITNPTVTHSLCLPLSFSFCLRPTCSEVQAAAGGGQSQGRLTGSGTETGSPTMIPIGTMQLEMVVEIEVVLKVEAELDSTRVGGRVRVLAL